MDCRVIDYAGECISCGAHVAETCRGSWPQMPPPSKVLIASWERTEREWQRYLDATDRDQWREYLGVMWSPGHKFEHRITKLCREHAQLQLRAHDRERAQHDR